ncbi:MAG: tetratricopeptide repeat protein [Candidatus Eisenbacteria bacterium]|nr:tetratricopeptide repeat protein [Candidatus Eisenbacteria bacterium]
MPRKDRTVVSPPASRTGKERRRTAEQALPTGEPQPPPRWMTGACAALIILQWAAAFVPGHLLWGFYHLDSVPLAGRTVWALAGLLGIWAAQRPRWLEPSARLVAAAGRTLWRRAWALAAVIAVCGAAFWLLRNRTHFLGDGYLIGELVERGVLFRTYDLLDFTLHALLWNWMQGLAEMGAFQLYAVVSVFLGIAYILAAHWTSERLVDDPSGRLLLLALLVMAGPLEMFFGYVESYGFQAILILLYLGHAILYLRGRNALWRPALFFGLALAFHTTTIFLLPTLIYLAWRRPDGGGRGRRWAVAFGTPLVLFVAAVAFEILAGYRWLNFEFDVLESEHTQSVFVPLSGDHGFFSFYHWKDLFNQIFLLAPVPLLLVLATLLRRPRRLWDAPERRCLTVGVAVLVVLFASIDRKLGGARDWDLFAAHIPVLTFLGFLAYRARADAQHEAPAGKAPVLILTAFFLAAPWFWVHASAERSIQRFRAVVADFAPFPRAYAHEELAKYFRKRDRHEEAVREYERCVEAYPGNPRFRVLLGGVLAMVGDVERAIHEIEAALEKNPEYAAGWRMLISIYQQSGRVEETLPFYVRLAELQPQDSDLWYNLGIVARLNQRPDLATAALEQSLALADRPQARIELAVSHGLAQRWSEAEELLRPLLDDPQSGDRARLALGSTLVTRVQKDTSLTDRQRWELLRRARSHLVPYVRGHPGDAAARRTLERVEQLLQEGAAETP